ncbi:MAG: alpha-galactosidase [Eubacteriales bacterium]|nr:alpha-galactosidase [Eubacteriales bacterium]
MKLREPDFITVYTEEGIKSDKTGVDVKFKSCEKGLKTYITSDYIPVKYIKLRWNFLCYEKRRDIKILGDDWERAYGTLEWRGIFPERCMPWYCLVSDGEYTESFGVAVRPSALCFWQYDSNGIILWLDVRCGGKGVELNGRTLEACEIIFAEYSGVSAYEAGKKFCRLMSDKPKTVSSPVYGSNNWYYAYGKFTRDEVIQDTKQLMALCSDNKNIPYMVIDDGWQKYNCDAPWTPRDSFGSVSAMAEEIASLGAIPGIWIRPLADYHNETSLIKPKYRLEREKNCLDPTNGDVLEYVKQLTRQIAADGYRLIKHDYTTFDIFGNWGCFCPNTLTKDGWAFGNRQITSAEAVLNLYSAIREAAGDAVIIGCNTVSHLSAGIFELNRTGDDTSGFDWDRTRKFGVNTLAFRGIQHKVFYECDADCVGITGKIPWELNREWLRLLSMSGTPLFVSCKPGICDARQLEDIKIAFARASLQTDECLPLDWMNNAYPERYLINGKEEEFKWYNENPTDVFNSIV